MRAMSAASSRVAGRTNNIRNKPLPPVLYPSALCAALTSQSRALTSLLTKPFIATGRNYPRFPRGVPVIPRVAPRWGVDCAPEDAGGDAVTDRYYSTFARYNAWANARLYAACAKLPESEYL